MPTLDDVYRKFGETAEAAQLLETELGNLLFFDNALGAGLLERPDPDRAADLLERVDRQTLGRLLKNVSGSNAAMPEIENKLTQALIERNRLSHSFYRQHNFRRNSDEGRAFMLKDLDAIHETILCAYKAVMLAQGVDLDEIAKSNPPMPTRHLPI